MFALAEPERQSSTKWVKTEWRGNKKHLLVKASMLAKLKIYVTAVSRKLMLYRTHAHTHSHTSTCACNDQGALF